MEQLRTATSEMRVPRKLPLVGNLPMLQQFQVLGVMTVTFLVFAAIMVFLESRNATQHSAAAATATEMQMLSQRLARGTALAAQGQAAAFAAVKDSRDRFKTNLDALVCTAAPSAGVDLDVAQDPRPCKLLQDIQARWDARRRQRPARHRQPAAPDDAGQGAGRHQPGQQRASSSSRSRPRSRSGRAAESLREIEYANQLAVLSQRIAKNANTLASSDEIDPEVAFLLGKDSGTFRDILNGLTKGSDALRLAPRAQRRGAGDARRAGKRFAVYDGGVAAILQNMNRLVAAKQAARGINAESEPLLDDTTQARGAVRGRRRRPRLRALGGGRLRAARPRLPACCWARCSSTTPGVRAYESEQENKRNQEAILRLLNEMGNLADGDLTVQASVTEDVTGAIADSINFTIEELRTLVQGHQLGDRPGDAGDAGRAGDLATGCSRLRSGRTARSSRRRRRCCRWRSRSTKSPQTAAQSARVAQQSLAGRREGRAGGAEPDRGHERDPHARSRTRRSGSSASGESSLEIGEIVELISDITEQTNVLALNAAIQAASAGEAGRGFTVVAEEVQRLAERSGEATKQIEAIVKTIQADTQDAVAAMEKRTVGVVEGTKLSDAAGQALERDPKVSRELAALIGGISHQTTEAVRSVTDVTRGMQGILKITEETTEGTKQTNVSIGQLTRLAAELRSSVAGFKV